MFSENTKSRPFIWGMQHHLLVLYQVCSNNDNRAKNGPATWPISFT